MDKRKRVKIMKNIIGPFDAGDILNIFFSSSVVFIFAQVGLGLAT